MMPCDAVRSWAAVAASITALDPDVVEALDEEGAILRVLSSDDMVKPAREALPPPPPPAPKPLSNDPETRRFELFATLLSDAYRHSTEVAFEKMVDLFAAVNKQGENTHKSLENMHKLMRRALEDRYDDLVDGAVQQAQPPKDELTIDDLAKAFVGGQASNGKAQA